MIRLLVLLYWRVWAWHNFYCPYHGTPYEWHHGHFCTPCETAWGLARDAREARWIGWFRNKIRFAGDGR